MEFVQPIRDKSKIEEIEAVLRRKSYRDYILFKFGIHTGLRISDILKFKVKDIRGRTTIDIREQKTGKSKRVKLPDWILPDLKEYIVGMKAEDFLFPSSKTENKAIDRVRVYKILNAAAREVGIEDKIGTHTLRKTFGYHFYQQTKDATMLQEIFNHSAPSVTKRYIGINQEMIEDVLKDFKI